MKPAIVGFAFVCAVGVLIWQAFSSMVPVLTVNQVLSEEYTGGMVQVDGGKIIAIEGLAPLKFTVGIPSDEASRITVVSTQPVPENFKVDLDVSIRGEFDQAAGVFHATRVTTKCPSRYEASEAVYEGGTEYAPAPSGTADPPAKDSTPAPDVP